MDDFKVGSRVGGKVKYNRPGGAIVTVNRAEAAEVLRAINVCCCASLDVDGIPDRQPTAEESAAALAEAEENGGLKEWNEGQARKSDTYEYLGTLKGPSMKWLQRAQERHNKRQARKSA